MWGDEHQVTAVELNEEIAKQYKVLFPNDTMVVGDAHKYLLENYMNFDFIWSSPPCPSHSRMAISGKNTRETKYPSMKLYEEILMLQNFHIGKYVIENVIPYYKPLVEPTICLSRHLFWTNFYVIGRDFESGRPIAEQTANMDRYGFSLKGIKMKHRKDQILRNLVDPEIGLHLLNCAKSNFGEQKELFVN